MEPDHELPFCLDRSSQDCWKQIVAWTKLNLKTPEVRRVAVRYPRLLQIREFAQVDPCSFVQFAVEMLPFVDVGRPFKVFSMVRIVQGYCVDGDILGAIEPSMVDFMRQVISYLQPDHTLDDIKNLLGAVGDVVRFIVGRQPDRLPTYLRSLMASLAGDDTTLEVARQLLSTVNALLETLPRDQRSSVRRQLDDQLPALPKLLAACGDYDVQASLVECLFRLSTQDERPTLAASWLPTSELQRAFVSIANFDPDCRLLLNAFNRRLGADRMVHSFPAESVLLADYALLKPADAAYRHLWVDFNEGSGTVLVYCQRPVTDTQRDDWLWETVTVQRADVLAVRLRLEAVNQVLTFTMAQPCRCLLASDALAAFDGNTATFAFVKGHDLHTVLTRLYGTVYKFQSCELLAPGRQHKSSTAIQSVRCRPAASGADSERSTKASVPVSAIHSAGGQPSAARARPPKSSVVQAPQKVNGGERRRTSRSPSGRFSRLEMLSPGREICRQSAGAAAAAAEPPHVDQVPSPSPDQGVEVTQSSGTSLIDPSQPRSGAAPVLLAARGTVAQEAPSAALKRGAPSVASREGISGLAATRGISPVASKQGTSGATSKQGTPCVSATQGTLGINATLETLGDADKQLASSAPSKRAAPGTVSDQSVSDATSKQGVQNTSPSKDAPISASQECSPALSHGQADSAQTVHGVGTESDRLDEHPLEPADAAGVSRCSEDEVGVDEVHPPSEPQLDIPATVTSPEEEAARRADDLTAPLERRRPAECSSRRRAAAGPSARAGVSQRTVSRRRAACAPHYFESSGSESRDGSVSPPAVEAPAAGRRRRRSPAAVDLDGDEPADGAASARTRPAKLTRQPAGRLEISWADERGSDREAERARAASPDKRKQPAAARDERPAKRAAKPAASKAQGRQKFHTDGSHKQREGDDTKRRSFRVHLDTSTSSVESRRGRVRHTVFSDNEDSASGTYMALVKTRPAKRARPSRSPRIFSDLAQSTGSDPTPATGPTVGTFKRYPVYDPRSVRNKALLTEPPSQQPRLARGGDKAGTRGRRGGTSWKSGRGRAAAGGWAARVARSRLPSPEVMRDEPAPEAARPAAKSATPAKRRPNQLLSDWNSSGSQSDNQQSPVPAVVSPAARDVVASDLCDSAPPAASLRDGVTSQLSPVLPDPTDVTVTGVSECSPAPAAISVSINESAPLVLCPPNTPHSGSALPAAVSAAQLDGALHSQLSSPPPPPAGRQPPAPPATQEFRLDAYLPPDEPDPAAVLQREPELSVHRGDEPLPSPQPLPPTADQLEADQIRAELAQLTMDWECEAGAGRLGLAVPAAQQQRSAALDAAAAIRTQVMHLQRRDDQLLRLCRRSAATYETLLAQQRAAVGTLRELSRAAAAARRQAADSILAECERMERAGGRAAAAERPLPPAQVTDDMAHIRRDLQRVLDSSLHSDISY